MKIIRINTLQSMLIALLIVPTAVFGWYLPIRNNTPYAGQFDVHYPGCSSDTVVVQPGQEVQVNAKGCLATQINGHLVRGGGKPVIHLAWSSSGHRDFSATIVDKGNGNFVIHPSYLGAIDLIQRDLVKPTEKAFVQLGKDIERDLLKPTEKAFVQLGQDINKEVIKPLEKAFSKESFDKAGQDINRAVIKPIETAFVNLGKDIEKGFIDFGRLFEKEVINPVVAAGDVILSKFKDCGDVVALGSEWAAKKSAYEAAQGSLMVVNEINEADPLQYGVIAVKEAALLGLDAGKLGAEGLAHMMEGMGVLIGGGFNITEVSFDVQANDLVQGKLPLFKIKGYFFGKFCDMSFQFDVNKPEESFMSIVKELIKIVPGV